MYNIEDKKIDFFISRFLLERLPETSTLTKEDITQISDIINKLGKNFLNGDTCLAINDKDSELLLKSGIAGKDEKKPLVVDRGMLYFQKYWLYEKDIAEILKKKASSKKDISEPIREKLDKLFPSNNNSINYQKLAAIVALSSELCIISGAPGTGKTTTVAKIIDLMISENSDIKIAVAAPTGKAVARVRESVQNALKSKEIENSDKFPKDFFTIHRLLKVSQNLDTFRYNSSNKLPYELLIVDEVSMVDTLLMRNLLKALKDRAILILIGDKDQLASVESGAIMAEICSIGKINSYSTKFLEKNNLNGKLLPSEIEFTDSMVELKENYRFKDSAGIYNLSNLIKDSENISESDIDNIFKNSSDIKWFEFSDKFPEELQKMILAHFQAVASAKNIEEMFEEFNKLMLLTPYRNGNFGIEFFNSYINKLLLNKGLVTKDTVWFNGKPLIINKNDYSLKLFNGDIGLCFQGEIYFKYENNFISKTPDFLNNYDICHSMTVHKSQGSEFDNIILLLGNRDSDILTKELIYTAITRAKSKVFIWGEKDIFIKGLNTKVKRVSALSRRLVD